MIEGEWSYPSADESVWKGRLSIAGSPVIEWRSIARYCIDTDIFCGRTPTLRHNGEARPFEEAVAFAEQLGQKSKWMRPEQERSLVGEQRVGKTAPLL